MVVPQPGRLFQQPYIASNGVTSRASGASYAWHNWLAICRTLAKCTNKEYAIQKCPWSGIQTCKHWVNRQTRYPIHLVDFWLLGAIISGY